MERKRFANDEKTDHTKNPADAYVGGGNDSDKCDAVKGYKKLACILLVFVAILLLKFFVIDIVTVYGDSMNDSFLEDDIVIINCMTQDIARFDVVVVKAERQIMIKRVIGLPNETIYVKDGKVYINGEAIVGEFDIFTEDGGIANEPYTLGEDEYFLMGDNRGVSYDSRGFGSVTIEQIRGVVTFRIFPFGKFGSVAHGEIK